MLHVAADILAVCGFAVLHIYGYKEPSEAVDHGLCNVVQNTERMGCFGQPNLFKGVMMAFTMLNLVGACEQLNSGLAYFVAEYSIQSIYLDCIIFNFVICLPWVIH